jgi:Beta-lactamase
MQFLAWFVGVLFAVQPSRPPSAYAPSGTPVELGLAGYAKVLCSAIYVSGRDAHAAAKNSGFFMMPEGQADKVTWTVDRDAKIVRMTLGGVPREAKFYGDQGCIVHQQNKPGIFFTPEAVKTTLPDAATQPWPMGDAEPAGPRATGLDQRRIDAAVDAAFADPAALTAAFVVLHKGRIVAERYMPGITKDTQLESWSMGKSITSTLFGLLVKDGTYTLEQPAPVPDGARPTIPAGRSGTWICCE